MSLTFGIPALVVVAAGFVFSVPMRALSSPFASSLRRTAAGAAVSSTATAVGLYLLLPTRPANGGSCPDLGEGGSILFLSLGLLTAVLAAVAVGAAIRTRREQAVSATMGLVVALVYVVPVLMIGIGFCGD